ncbi:MAG: thiamine pyrophosphate-requiring protein [Acetobacteraceae bacterium]|nr:thiamine pyrophosphate-requiring protein [Acetobacteraceae bacterium]
MAKTVSDFFWERMYAWGVRRVFGYPGDGINGLLGGLQRNGKIDLVQVRHEEMAAFMASAHAKFTGDVGICMATSGPGAIHLLNGLYDARLDHMPVVAIVGQQGRGGLGAHYQQEVDLQNLFKDVAGAFVMQASVPEQVRHLIDRAMRIAKVERTVTCIILPNDLQEKSAVESPPHEHGYVMSGIGAPIPEVVPTRADLQRAAEVLNAGKKVAMLVGAGAKGATDEVIQAAEKLGAGIAKALLGKDVVPDDLPYVTGSIGLLGTKPSYELMMNCDTFFMIGSGFPYTEFLPKEGAARGVQIDINPGMLSIRYAMEVNLLGDARATLRELLPLLEHKSDRSWRQSVEKNVEEWWKVIESQAMTSADPLNPQRVVWELSPRVPDRCIVTSDSGSIANWYARDLKMRRGMMGSLSGGLASMGAGVPYAIGAKFAYPDRPVIALIGDGAAQMNNMAEMITVAKYWKQWPDPRFITMVLNNRDLNQVTWEQRVQTGIPKYEASQSIPDVSYSKFAELIGLKGIFVDNPDNVGRAWEQALAADRPVILEAYTDPNVPPLPPHITLKQARSFAASTWGEPELSSVVKETAKEMMHTLVPGR